MLIRLLAGSPFRVAVRDRLDANRVNVKMSEVMRANVLQEILIDGQLAGAGVPSVDISDIHGMCGSISGMPNLVNGRTDREINSPSSPASYEIKNNINSRVMTKESPKWVITTGENNEWPAARMLTFSILISFLLAGRRKPANIRPRGEGIYVAEFTPQIEGPHRIDINWSDQPILQRYLFTPCPRCVR